MQRVSVFATLTFLPCAKVVLLLFDSRFFEHDMVVIKRIKAGMIEKQMQILSFRDGRENRRIVKFEFFFKFRRHGIFSLLRTVAGKRLIRESTRVFRFFGNLFLPFFCEVFHISFRFSGKCAVLPGVSFRKASDETEKNRDRSGRFRVPTSFSLRPEKNPGRRSSRFPSREERENEWR